MGQTHHNGISVYGSGIAFGPKNLEQTMIDCSGVSTSSLHIQPQSLDQVIGLQTNTGIRFDGGTFSVSGWKNKNVSTKLSSILFAMAAPVMPTNGLVALASGFCDTVGVMFSGNQLDFTLYAAVSGNIMGGVTSCGTSSQVSFICAGI